ncbi:uncharacterized protein LOC102807520 [Saccoglossus kowalevskii]|uniref:Uncharacterized protein LOC102807520 n=1 Tax=Saccoglossus kowalevskii TaxID=10224 RepID=A0ABM0M6K0_SACKO|nr:PREDICTED: uncharacterized protein LOC102807520 [Saccoglossus kowalevskii]
MQEDKTYLLLLEDGTQATFIPGQQSKEFFSLCRYREELGKDYQRICMYLCTEKDYNISEGVYEVSGKENDSRPDDARLITQEFDENTGTIVEDIIDDYTQSRKLRRKESTTRTERQGTSTCSVSACTNMPGPSGAYDKNEIKKFVTYLTQKILKSYRLSVEETRYFVCVKGGLKHKSFSPFNKISVKFTDDEGSSEGAVDEGGPMREMLTLTMNHIVGSHLLDVHRTETVKPTTEDLPVDSAVKEDLQKLRNVNVEEANSIICETLKKLLELAGTWKHIQSEDDKENVIWDINKWYLFGRTKTAVDQFKIGPSTLGVLAAIQEYPFVFKPSFCYEAEPLTAATFAVSEKVVITRSENESNAYNVESRVLAHWADFLQDDE